MYVGRPLCDTEISIQQQPPTLELDVLPYCPAPLPLTLPSQNKHNKILYFSSMTPYVLQI